MEGWGRLTTIKSPSGVPFQVATPYAEKFRGLIGDLEAAGYPLRAGQSGGFNPRFIAGTRTPSQHAFGRAIDVNWDSNARGSKGDIPADVARSLAQKYGLTWGGDWKNPDPMHFEMGGPRPMSERGLVTAAGLKGPATNDATDTQGAPRVGGGEAAMSNDGNGMGFLAGLGANPLFLAGLSILGDPDRNVGRGLQTGFGAANQMQDNRARERALSRDDADRAAWGKLLQSGQFGTMAPVLSQIGPERGAPLLIDLMRRAREDDFDRQKWDTQRKLIEAQTASAERRVDDSKYYEVNGRIVKVAPDGKASEVYANPSPVDALIKNMMPGGPPPAAPSPGPAPAPVQPPQVLPQSNAAPQAADPLLRLAADRVIPVDQPAPAAPAQTPSDMIDTPFGKMDRQKARQLGGAMLLDPRYAMAGKAILEAADAKGSGPDTALGKEVSNEIDKKEFNATEYLSRLGNIEAQFDPKFLTIENKLKNYAVSWADSFETLRKKLPKERLAELQNFTKFKQSALENINAYIKEITGAQMSEAEADRIRQAAPDPINDSPTMFQTKTRNAVNQARLAVVRYRYLRKNGFQGQTWTGSADDASKAMPLPMMEKLLNNRASELLQEARQSNPRGTDQSWRAQAKQRLSQEFGI